MRVFLGLIEVSGFYTHLKEGFDELNICSKLVSLYSHPFAYGEGETDPLFVRWARCCVAGRMRRSSSNAITRLFWLGLDGIGRMLVFLWAVVKFDVFIFCSASSFFRYRELPLLRLLGKTIIYNFHGTDSRPAYIDGFCESRFMSDRGAVRGPYVGYIGEGEPPYEAYVRTMAYIRAARARKNAVSWIDRFSHVVINSPSHGQFHERPFVQRLIVGIPCVTKGVLSKSVKRGPDYPVRILHCPSVPEGKGTVQIRKAIAAIKRRGHSVDYVEITGKANEEVLKAISECDFVVDQAYSDMPMMGFATEAASFGKPALIGGYYWEQMRDDIEESFIPPALFCHPEMIQESIQRLVTDEEFRRELGRRAYEFVRQHWTPRKVAERFVRMSKADIPQEWLYDPKRIRYVHGMGLSEARVRRIVLSVLQYGGQKALQLEDKPELKERLVQFASESSVSMSTPDVQGVSTG